MKLKIKLIIKDLNHEVLKLEVGVKGVTEIREVLSQANRDCVEIYHGDNLFGVVFEPDFISYDQEGAR